MANKNLEELIWVLSPKEITVDPEGKIRRITSLQILLPDAFTPGDLGKG